MKAQLKNNFGMKVLSVLIAVMIWLLVANTNDPVVTKRFSNIEVTITNENVLTDQGYSYVVKEGQEVTLTVKGKNSIVGSLTASDFNAVADFSKLSQVNAVPIDVSAKKYDDQLEISLGTINTMKIETDELVDVSVPVNIVTTGEPAEGYAVGKTTGTPNLVKVTGPENLVSEAKEIRAEVNVDGFSKDVTTTAKPVLYDENGDEIDTSQIVFDTPTIAISIEVWKTKQVSVSLDYSGEPADGYQLVSFDYEPKEITVAAPSDVLKELTSITLPEISLDGLKEDYEEDIDLTAQNILPDDVTLAEDETDIKVKATIEAVKTKKIVFSAADITVQGKKGRSLIFDDANVYEISVDGPGSAVDALKITDFAPWINVKELSEGEHTVTVHVKEIDGVTINSVPEITVTLGEN